MIVNNGTGSFGINNYPINTTNNYPDIFDSYGVVGQNYPASDRLINSQNNSTQLAQKLTSNNIYFDGSNSYFVNDMNLPKLYAPTHWLGGSSFSHLDDNTYPAGNSNSLMTHETNYAEVIHSPGEVGLTIMQDLGWSVNRVITIINPIRESTWAKGQTYNIEWTDNMGGVLSINLYKVVNDILIFEGTLESSTQNKGTRSLSWTIPTNPNEIPVGQYRIKFENGGIAWGLSSLFSISDQQQVATPTISPKSGEFTSQQQVTISCLTPDVDIYYTLDGNKPSITSEHYENKFYVQPPVTIKAIAFKDGWVESIIASEVYEFINNAITIYQKDSDENSFGAFSIWNITGLWINNIPSGTPNANSTPLTIRADQSFKEGTLQKFNYWVNNLSHSDYLNWNTFSNFSGVTGVTAQFNNTTGNTVIQNSIDGDSTFNNNIKFSDPWYIDYLDVSYANSKRNRGMKNNGSDALQFRERTSPFHPDLGTIYQNGSDPAQSYKGVFLNQLYTGSNPVYYSVQAISPQTITVNGQVHTAYFQNWAGNGVNYKYPYSLETPIAFTDSNATAEAIFKGIHLSNNANAISNSGQRKVVQSYDGILHMVYESMDKCWYEKSTDNGQTWDLVGALNSGRKAKNPSIDWFRQPPSQAGDGYEKVTIVYDGLLPDLSGWGVLMENFNKISGEYVDDNSVSLLSDINHLFTENHNSYPVIALGKFEKFMACWNDDQGNLIYGVGSDFAFGGFGSWNNGFPDIFLDNSVCNNFSLSSSKEFDQLDGSSYYIAAEIDGPTSNEITVFEFKYPSYSFGNYAEIDGYSGYSFSGHSTNPTVAMITRDLGGGVYDKRPIVAWIGQDPSNNNTIGYAAVLGLSSGELTGAITNFSSFGNNVTSVNVSAPHLGNNNAVVTYSENNGSSSGYKLFQSNTFGSSMYILPSGKEVILSDGGNDTDDIRGYTLSNSSPYEIVETEFLKSIPSVISSNYTVSFGTYWIDNSITVNSGATLTIQPGAKLYFASGTSLIVNGVLNANGTSEQQITFTSALGTSPGSWGYIQISGPYASGSSIKYANIQYGTEIDVTNADAVIIQNCNIENQSQMALHIYGGADHQVEGNTFVNSNIYHGIAIDGAASSVYVNGNTITKNSPNTGRGVALLYGGGTDGNVTKNDISGWDWGIGAIWGASIESWLSTTPDRNNRIRNCYDGLVAYYSGYVDFGLSLYGNKSWGNSIYNNSYNTAIGTSYSSYPSYVDAEMNWWGSNPPNTSMFLVGSGSSFDYSSPLSSDPWAGLAKMGSISAQSSTKDTTSLSTLALSGEGPLFQAMELRRNKKYTEAKNMLKSFITKNPDNQRAYVELYNCYSKETANDIIDFFNSLPEKKSKDNDLLIAYLYKRDGKINMAKAVNERIIAQNKNTSLANRAMINNLYMTLYDENNINEAVNIFRKILEHPELSTEMELTDVENTIKSYAKSLSKAIADFPDVQKSLAKINEIPRSYELYDNFPNPFNPSTTIRYDLPKDGIVTIKVYDILGREVTTLVNELKSAGRYNITFNAANLASGVYIYRLKAGDFVATKKLVLMK